MTPRVWKSLAQCALCAVCATPACVEKASMMRSEEGALSGRAADVASRQASEYEQQKLAQQAAAAVEASEAQVGAERGAADEGQPGSPEEPAGGRTLYLECGDEGPGFVVRVEGEQARLFLPDGEVDLARMPAGSGTKYTDGKTVLWTKESAAIFEDADGRRYMCSNNPSVAVWQDARRRGVTLRGFGEGWVLELSPYSTVLVTDEGTKQFDMQTPEPQKDGAKRSYFGRDGEMTLHIKSEPKTCVDPDTGEKFGLSLEVDLGGRFLNGCGRDLRGSEP